MYEKAIAVHEFLDQPDLQISLMRRYSKLLKQAKRNAEAERIDRRISDVQVTRIDNH
jgi:hypothetical protein